MPFIYFGYPPKRSGTKTAVSTPYGDIEPIEPSKVRVYTQTAFSPIFSLASSILGLLVSILSYPFGYYHSISVPGLMIRTENVDVLPFSDPGLAVVVKKGRALTDAQSGDLESRGFTTMSFSGRTVFLKEEPTLDDFLSTNDLLENDPIGPCPARYLHTQAFESWLTLVTITGKVCELFSTISSGTGRIGYTKAADKKIINVADNDEWKLAESDDSLSTPDPKKPFVFKKRGTYVYAKTEEALGGFIKYAAGADMYSGANSGVVVNHIKTPGRNFIQSGESSSISRDGLIFKFEPRIALPDPNLIGDIIGRYFLHCLGDSLDDQIDNLSSIKNGLSHLRLTRVGDEMTHLWKCIETAIRVQSGCVPFFSGSVYEGCVILGGIGGVVTIGDTSSSFLPVEKLKDEFLNVSAHTSALANISNFWPEESRHFIRRCTSMWILRGFCLANSITQDERDSIIRFASYLDFGIPSWPVNPHNIAQMALLMQNLPLNGSVKTPISRLCLFSRDPVMIALSCFGEKTAPSWDIPNGILCSWAKATPPVPKVMATTGKATGNISDAAWTMVVRKTDLVSATEEFRRMAGTMKYRSTSSVVAKKVGHQTYNSARMMEFWAEIRKSLKIVNPHAVLEQEDVGSGNKRSLSSEDTVEGDGKQKKQKLGFARAGRYVQKGESIVQENEDDMEEEAEDGEIPDVPEKK